MTSFGNSYSAGDRTRHPAVAGRFYEADSSALKREIQDHLSRGRKLDDYPRMIISPHAGYVFSGPVAGIGFATIDPSTKKVLLLGPSHHKWFEGMSIPDVDYYETPLGGVPLDDETISQLRNNSLVHAYTEAHALEHCLEVQVPFLQTMLQDFRLIPILVGGVNHRKAAELLASVIDDSTLVVISSDLSHYASHDEAKKRDAGTVEAVLSGNRNAGIDACGEAPIRIAMELAKSLNLRPHLLDARNSYDTAPQYGSPGRVVGYASIVYLPNHSGSKIPEGSEAEVRDQPSSHELSSEDKSFFLSRAREALERSVRGELDTVPSTVPPVGREKRGCFVTLTKAGRLRGCIGYLSGIKPLHEAVADNARNAALSDPRFPKVGVDELSDIRIEISVLTNPSPMEYESPEDLLEKIRPGIDGVILRKGGAQSTFLPQVWEQLPEKTSFLEHLAQKAGLAADAWKTADYQLYQALHFEENP